MKPSDRAGDHRPSDAEERRSREASLDRTIEASFPASDPPSTDPNPDAHDAIDNEQPEDTAVPPRDRTAGAPAEVSGASPR
jgi:hypothetical protein